MLTGPERAIIAEKIIEATSKGAVNGQMDRIAYIAGLAGLDTSEVCWTRKTSNAALSLVRCADDRDRIASLEAALEQYVAANDDQEKAAAFGRAFKVVDAILVKLEDRRGFKHLLRKIEDENPDIFQEIREELVDTTAKVFDS